MVTSSKRNAFLGSFLDALRSNGVPFCILRNHHAFWQDGPSDIDMMVMPHHLDLAVKFLEISAESNSYRLASQIQFNNLCLIYHAENIGFVRIDIETALRWHTHTLLPAKTILNSCVDEDGLAIPCPEHETLILLTQCAWAGNIKDAYRTRLNLLIDKNGSQIFGFLNAHLGINRGNLLRIINNEAVGEFRKILRDAKTPKERIKNIANFIKRAIRRIISPPGLMVKYSGLSKEVIDLMSTKMELLFPSAKAAQKPISCKKIMGTLLRGGIVWLDVESNLLCQWFARLWIGKYRYFEFTCGHIHHPESNQSADKKDAHDFIGRILSDNL